MNRLLLAVSLALAATAAHAQQQTAASAPTSVDRHGEARAELPAREITLQPGVQAYSEKRRNRIDHSKDRLIVEPTRSSIIILEVSPRVDQRPRLDESYSRQ